MLSVQNGYRRRGKRPVAASAVLSGIDPHHGGVLRKIEQKVSERGTQLSCLAGKPGDSLEDILLFFSRGWLNIYSCISLVFSFRREAMFKKVHVGTACVALLAGKYIIQNVSQSGNRGTHWNVVILIWLHVLSPPFVL